MEQISLRTGLIIFRGRSCDFSLERFCFSFFHQVLYDAEASGCVAKNEVECKICESVCMRERES